MYRVVNLSNSQGHSNKFHYRSGFQDAEEYQYGPSVGQFQPDLNRNRLKADSTNQNMGPSCLSIPLMQNGHDEFGNDDLRRRNKLAGIQT